jgi:protein Tob/BTG
MEFTVAADWWASQLSSKFSHRQKSAFAHTLSQNISKHCEGHWYPTEPERGSAYRSISNDHRVDPLLVRAAMTAGIEDIADSLPNAVVWVNPGCVKVRTDNPPHSTIIYQPDSIDSLEGDHPVCFNIWVENVLDEMEADLESMFGTFGPLCSTAEQGIPPVALRGSAHGGNRGAYVNFLRFADARAAIDACRAQAVTWGLHKGVAIIATARAVGNTRFVLALLEGLSSSHPAALSYADTARLHAAAHHPWPAPWREVLQQCTALLAADDSACRIELACPAEPRKAPSPPPLANLKRAGVTGGGAPLHPRCEAGLQLGSVASGPARREGSRGP